MREQNIFTRMSIEESHDYTLMYSIVGKIIKRDELEHFIDSHDVVSAVKSISYKPIGLYLGRLLALGISLENIDKIIEEYLIDSINYIYANTPLKHYKIIASMEKPYDLLNLCIMYNNIREERKASSLFPGGIIYAKKIRMSNRDDVISILKMLELIHKLEALVVSNESTELIILKGFEELQKTYFSIQDNVLKKVYGLIFDYSLIKSLSSLSKEAVEQVTVYPIFVDKEVIDLIARGKVSSEELIDYIVKHDPVLKSIYGDLSAFSRGFTALDFSHIIHLLVTTNNMIMPNTPQPYIRALLLVRAEAVFIRFSIMALLGYVDKDLIRNVISKWWIK